MSWMKYFTVKEVANKYSVHPRTVVRWIKKGDLSAVCLVPHQNRGYRISEASLDDFEVTRVHSSVHEDVSRNK